MPTYLSEFLTKLVALRIGNFSTKYAGGHPVRLIRDNDVPFVRPNQFLLELFITSQHIQASDQKIPVIKRITRTGTFNHVTSENVKLKIELLTQFILPLLHQTAGSDDKAAFHITTSQQLFYEQPSHNSFSSARIVCEQEAKRLPSKHFAINCCYLVRQRVDQAGMNS